MARLPTGGWFADARRGLMAKSGVGGGNEPILR